MSSFNKSLYWKICSCESAEVSDQQINQRAEEIKNAVISKWKETYSKKNKDSEPTEDDLYKANDTTADELYSEAQKQAESELNENKNSLKSAWLIGPSKAIKSKSKGAIIEFVSNSDNQQSNDSVNASDSTNNSSNKDNTTSSDNNNSSTNNSNNNQSQSESYSILDSFLGLNLLLEESDDTPTQVNNREDDDKTEVNPAPQNNSSNTSSDSVIVRVGIKDTGFTDWHIKILQHVDKVKGLIKRGSFKEAYNLASNKIDGDGIIISKAETYIIKKQNAKDINKAFPPFIGHCRYAIDAGTVDDSRDSSNDANLTISLAVAPINAVTKKPKDGAVFNMSYDVVGDITGGKVGSAIASISKAVRDSSDNKNTFVNSLFNSDDRYNSDDKDSETSKADYLSKFLHKAFRTPGDHTMYSNFIAIKKYIKQCLDKKLLQETKDGYTLGGSPISSETSIPPQFKNNWLIWY